MNCKAISIDLAKNVFQILGVNERSAPFFAERRGGVEVGMEDKNYYVTESVGIATGILITALHNAGLATLTHTPKPMGFLNKICNRPVSNKAYILMVVGYPEEDATVPQHALIKKSLDDIVTYL